MAVDLTDAEQSLLDRIPEKDLAEMALDLDLLLPAEIDRHDLTHRCLEALYERAGDEGLPLSKYDRGDLAALPDAHLEALGRHLGISGPVTVKAILRRGARTWRLYRKQRPNSATALLVPTLLGPLARLAYERR
jgi:hypothetical protein